MPIPTAQASPELGASQKARKKPTKIHQKSVSSHLDLHQQLLDAIQSERPRVVRRLLETRANPNIANAQNETALMLACSIQSEEARGTILKLLIRKGADVNLQDNSGQTALMRAVLLNDTDTALMLLDSHSDVGMEDRDGNNVLSHAAFKGNVELVRRITQEFRRKKLDVDKKNMRGLTPLLSACQEGHLECAKVLVLEGGASPSIRDLDNFMNAEEWMHLSGFCSSSDLEFLSPSTRRRNHRQRQRQLKDVKTLADYLPLENSKPSNVFSVCQPERPGAFFPHISKTTPSHNSTGVHPSSKSMFDVSPSSKQYTPGFAMGKPVPMQQISKPIPFSSSVKTDLYHSPYLARRHGYIARNRQSEFNHEGSLAPLGKRAQRRVSQLATLYEEEPVKHAPLPPIRRDTKPV